MRPAGALHRRTPPRPPRQGRAGGAAGQATRPDAPRAQPGPHEPGERTARSPSPPGPLRLSLTRVGVAAVAAVAAVAIAGCAPAPVEAVPPVPAPPAFSVAPASAAPTPGVPTRLVIPALDLDTPLTSLGVGPAGELLPPESAELAGWFAGGVVPGQTGPAVIAGHLDTRTGPGVFARLAELRPGDEVLVVRTDTTVRFRVGWTEDVAKDEFPTDRVYGPTPVPELRLITCGGEFDRSTGHYRSNVIVHTQVASTSG